MAKNEVTFKEYMDSCFEEGYTHILEFQGEIDQIKSLGRHNAFSAVEGGKKATLLKTLAVLINSAHKLSKVEGDMDKACIEAFKKTNPGQEGKMKDIKYIRDEIQAVSRLWLATIERMPFSLGSGWMAAPVGQGGRNAIEFGTMSTPRIILNIVGSMGTSLGLLWADSRFREKYQSYYDRSLEKYNQLLKEGGKLAEMETKNPDQFKKEVNSAIKELNSFYRVANQIARRWKRAKNNCQRKYDSKRTFTGLGTTLIDKNMISAEVEVETAS